MQRLQTLAPSHSTSDADIIRDLFADHQVFTGISDQSHRATILERVLSVRSLIPSLHTFFEDIKYLEPCAKVMRTLYGKNAKHSIYMSYMGSFFEPPQQLVEHARLDLRPCPATSSQLFKQLGYLQLWLFAFRNFPLLVNATPRKSPEKDKPVVMEPSPALWQALGELSGTLGFKTEHAATLQQSDPTPQLVAQLLRQCSSDATVDPQTLTQLCRVVRTLTGKAQAPLGARFTAPAALNTAQRCGRPYEDDHYGDQGRMYLPQMFDFPATSGPNITSFYRKWNMIRIFFGVNEVSLKDEHSRDR